MKSIYKNIILLLLPLIVLPQSAFAQSVFFTSSKNSYPTDTTFSATLFVNTAGNSVNTFEGKIVVPPSLDVVDIRYGSSIVALWVEKPSLNRQSGAISFSGGIPGGYNGSAGPILTIYMRSKSAQDVSLKPADFKILLNDGQGTELANVSLSPISFSIVKKEPVRPSEEMPAVSEEKKADEESQVPPADTVIPEFFIPMVARSNDIASNAYFVSFFAVDKDTGISHYEVFEKPFLSFKKEFWVKAETPYVLKNQLWGGTVYVKAYDQAGNYRVEKALKPFGAIIKWPTAILALILAGWFGFRAGVHSKRKKGARLKL